MEAMDNHSIKLNSKPPVTGLMPPQLGEALVREAWPTVLAHGAWAAQLAQWLMCRTWWIFRLFLVPLLAWPILVILLVLKFFPFFCKRYTLTNQRIMIRRGWKPSLEPAALVRLTGSLLGKIRTAWQLNPNQAVALADIDKVTFDPATYNSFYRSGDLEIISGGKVALVLIAVPEPEGFRRAIINACAAWVPGKAKAFEAWEPAKT
jgi:hypothetical protein